jgi:hypothetical protein
MSLYDKWTKTMIHPQTECFLCAKLLGDATYTYKPGHSAPFRVNVDSIEHTGRLCWSCYNPRSFGTDVSMHIRRFPLVLFFAATEDKDS